jgi:hypothetical protein
MTEIEDSTPLPERHRIYDEFHMENSRWDKLVPRDGDITICTPAKCGTTWMQMICALLVLQKTELDQLLSDYSPWLDMLATPIDDLVARLDAQTHQRFIKTHTPLDGLTYYKKTKYICVGRDPRDSFISMRHHLKNINPEFFALMQQNTTRQLERPERVPKDLKEGFRKWITSSCNIDDPKHGVTDDVLYYMKSFWPYRDLPNILMVHYSDLLADLDGEMRRIADFLDIEVPEALWPKLVKAAGFTSMKNNADTLAPQSAKNEWKDTSSFFYKGTNGQWQDELGEEELALYHQAMSENLEPELINWLENGRLRSGKN